MGSPCFISTQNPLAIDEFYIIRGSRPLCGLWFMPAVLSYLPKNPE